MRLNRESLRIKVNPENALPRILLFDIETRMMTVSQQVYSLKQYSTYLPHKSVTEPVKIVCLSWKWLGDNHISSVSVLGDSARFSADHSDDYFVVSVLRELLDAADIAVAHNGNGFDLKMAKTRMMAHGMDPIKDPVMIDTLTASRAIGRPESHSLSYLCRYFGLDAKDDSPDWKSVWSGDIQAIKDCERYCRQDVRALEALYLKIRPWIKNHPNLALHIRNQHHMACPSCNSENFQKRGTSTRKTGLFQRFHCNNCGTQFYNKKNLAIKPDTKL